MKTTTMVAIAVPAVAAVGIGGYFLFRRKGPRLATLGPDPYAAPPPSAGMAVAGRTGVAHFAATVGPSQAAMPGTAAWKTATAGVVNMAAGQASGIANKIIPGSGIIVAPIASAVGKVATATVQTALGTVGSSAKKALSKLKIW
jgi:hypothetical protein